MSQFSFTTDTQSEQFCRDIIQGIMHYGISESEALQRLNKFWKGQTFVGQYDLRYHRSVEEWVPRIYYGPVRYLSLYWAAKGLTTPGGTDHRVGQKREGTQKPASPN